MPAADPVPVHDTSLSHLGPSAEVYGLAVDSDQLEPLPADGRRRKKGMGVGAWLSIAWIGGLLLLAIDADRLGEDLRWEPSRGGALFPHLYASLPLGAVVDEVELPAGVPVDEAVARALIDRTGA